MKTAGAMILWTLLALAGLQGCSTRLEIGTPPRLERLAQLTPKVSTSNDVLLLLGEPQGYGFSRLDPNLPRERVWLYEYDLSEGMTVRITMLLVFFSRDAYTGYMWFADSSNLKAYRGDEKP